MITFLFIFLAGYAVRCDDNNYYVIQMPQDPKTLKVYWNVPTMQCKSKKIPFTNLFEKFGILQNDEDKFRGEKVSILYDPGLFPALLKNESSGQLKYRNGGVPQEGDLVKHLEVFTTEMEQSIPDKDFNGVGIIDFESWRPVFRQNFGVLTPYKDYSIEIERRRHWWWKKTWIVAEAKRRFEESGRAFMQTTLARAKQLRPKARWGYYGFPYCFNMAGNHMREECADNVPEENDSIDWLWSESSALYPSVYSSEALSSAQLASLIRRRVAEAARLRKKEAPILPYFWFRYQNGGYFRDDDLNKALSTLYKSEASGFIIWGSSKDVNTKDKCNKLYNYVNNVLGPAVAKYTKVQMKLQAEYYNDTNQTTARPNANVTTNPEYDWVQPENYTENIKHMVEKEMAEELNNPKKSTNDSLLIDLILHSIATYCFDCYDNVSENATDIGDNITAVSEDTKGSESRVVLVTEDPFKFNKTRETDETETIEENIAENYNETFADEYVSDSLENDSTTDQIITISKDGNEKPNHLADETSKEDTREAEDKELRGIKTNLQAGNTSISTEELTTSQLANSQADSTTEQTKDYEGNLEIENITENYTIRDMENSTAAIYEINTVVNANREDNGTIMNNGNTGVMTEADTKQNANSTDISETTSLSPALTKQVAGSAPRPGPRFIVCTLYFYSIAKCLCIVFNICSLI